MKIIFRPWLFVIFAFMLLLAAWTSLIFIATKYSPKPIVLETVKSR
jgi:hypothetical protein